MISARRLSAAVALLFFPLALSAQDVANWTAPPYWSSTRFPKLEKGDSDYAQIGVESIEAVPTPPLPFTGINPCRIVDTRGNGFTGAYGPPSLTQGSPRNFVLTGQCGISGSAQAVSLNITVTNTQGPGFILIYPQAGAQPGVSTLNYVAGQTVANAAVVPLGAGGGVTVIAGVSGTDLIIDTNGYYAPQAVVNTLNGLSGAVTLAQGSNISITPSGQTLTIGFAGGSSFWSILGNSGTTAGTHFLGTTDNQALELKVNGQRALRLEPNASGMTPNVIGGFSGNSVEAGKTAATIAGGGEQSNENLVTNYDATVGGGVGNHAGGFASTIGGGAINSASGTYATIPGGGGNTATGTYSFAAGSDAHALHSGAFVWGDASATTSSTGANQFLVRATGGAAILRTTAAPHGTGAALQIEHEGTGGEAAWLYGGNSSSSVQAAVIRLLKHPSASNKNFLECTDFDGLNPPIANKCHINAAGTFVNGSDFAEALPARDGKAGFEPGDVLVVSGNSRGTVEKSARRYDPRVIGVYSTRPGFLGADKDGDVRVDAEDIPVAITGIVPTKVTAENGPIEPGDLLTTSSTPGFAMKATPASVAGIEIYPTGTILGKALTPLKGERGQIKMLVLAR